MDGPLVRRQRHTLPEKEEDCPVFVDKDGNVMEVSCSPYAAVVASTLLPARHIEFHNVVLQAMCTDYGFRSGFGRLYQGGDGEIPKNLFELVRGLHQLLLLSRVGCGSPLMHNGIHAGVGQLQEGVQAAAEVLQD